MNGNTSLPAWALQRAATYLKALDTNEARRADPVELARRTGLSKSLARRCIRQLRHEVQRTGL